MSDMYLIWTALGSIVLLLFLVMKARLHAVIALILVSMIAGIATGMSPAEINKTIQHGMGGTLGFIAVVVSLGSMFGRIMEHTGALDIIGQTLVKKVGQKYTPWAIGFTGLICALPLFFDVAVVLLIGIVFATARRGGGSVTANGCSLLAGIAACQAYLIPTAGPVLVASQLGADFGYLIPFGILAAVPAMMLAGPVYGSWIAKRVEMPLPPVANKECAGECVADQPLPPTFSMAIVLILMPLMMIGLKSIAVRFVEPASSLHDWFSFIGHPFTAILVACFMAFYILGHRRGMSKQEIMDICSAALQPAGVIILVTGAGGVFKQVLVDSGVGDAIGTLLSSYNFSVVVLAFLFAAFVRVVQGSATVAMLTACGLIAPLLEPMNLTGAQLAVVTIAIGGGAKVLSHVNDSGFWLANRYLNLSETQTLKTWTVLDTIVGLTGLAVAVVIYTLV